MLKKCHPAILWTLITTAVACPAMVGAQTPGEMAGAAAARKPDLDYITPNTFAAAVAYPRSVLKSARVEYLPVEILSTVLKKELGLDPVEIEQAIFVAEPPKGVPPEGQPPEWAVVLKMASPIAGEVLPTLVRHTTEGTLDGKTYRKAKGPADPSIYQADERTLSLAATACCGRWWPTTPPPRQAGLRRCSAAAGRRDLLGVMLFEPLGRCWPPWPRPPFRHPGEPSRRPQAHGLRRLQGQRLRLAGCDAVGPGQ